MIYWPPGYFPDKYWPPGYWPEAIPFQPGKLKPSPNILPRMFGDVHIAPAYLADPHIINVPRDAD